MTSLRGKQALVVGGSSGIGRATVLALVGEGARVSAVARGAEGLRALGDQVTTVQGDAANPEFAARVMREQKPELLVLAAGVTPRMGPLDALDWATFSQAWNVDVQLSVHFLTQALQLPLAPGSTVVVLSSGAALHGSPRSGGYAGAKRMQWWLVDYAQRVSDERKLGLRFAAVLPDQLVAGTVIGTSAATTYAAMNGTTAEAFMRRYDAPLEVEGVAAAVLQALRGEVGSVAVKGTGVRAIP
jgi:NAD(P)-dependent dehydrogenase (short-subunit alcohol dehydrogenase family)